MPLVDINDPIHLGIHGYAEGAWGHPNTRAGISLVYSRHQVVPELRRRWAWLVPLLGLTSASSIVLVGAAWGYSMEILESDYGITRAIGLETSSGIRGKLNQSEDAEIAAAITAVGLNPASGEGLDRAIKLGGVMKGYPRSPKQGSILDEGMVNPGSRNRVRNAIQALGGTSWDVISENVLTVLSDAECVQYAGYARAVPGVARVIHLVSTCTPKRPPGHRDLPPEYNWKYLSDWKTLMSPDYVVSIYTREML